MSDTPEVQEKKMSEADTKAFQQAKAARRARRKVSRTAERRLAKTHGHKLGHNNVKCKRCNGKSDTFDRLCQRAT